MNLRYIDKKELFKFIKKCVLDFRISRRITTFIPYTRRSKIFTVLRDKFPELKNCDISLLIDLIDASEDKENIYSTIGLEKSKKKKAKKTKKKKVNLNEFLAKHFSIMDFK